FADWFALRIARGGQQYIQDTVLGGVFGLGLDAAFFDFASLFNRSADQVTNDSFHIASYVADFGKFGCLDFDKWGIGQFGQAAGDFGFTHAGGANHEDVFRDDFVAQGLCYLLPTPAVA